MKFRAILFYSLILVQVTSCSDHELFQKDAIVVPPPAENTTDNEDLETLNSYSRSLYSIAHKILVGEYFNSIEGLNNNLDSLLIEDTPITNLSIKDNKLYWMINGRVLNALADSPPPVFKKDNNCYYYSFDNGITWTVADSIRMNTYRLRIEKGEDMRFLHLFLSDTSTILLPTIKCKESVPDTIKKVGFYKDLFLDSGIGLTARKKLSATTLLSYSVEGVTNNGKDTIFQNQVIGGSEEDLNGRLLYPDGQPRYRVLFVSGGSSKTHGKSLTEKSRHNMQTFVKNGGSYVGTCAGAFFATNGYDGNTDYPYYLNVWPGMMQHTGLVNVRTGMVLEKESPLLNYYDWGDDRYIDSIRHNKGGYPDIIPEGTEILARFHYPQKEEVDGQPAIWTYKESLQSGRIIMEASHPEEVTSGPQLLLTAAMLQYASDNVGCITPKGFLHNGIRREMFKTTSDHSPEFTRIGDKQYHHFITYIPENTHAVSITLEYDEGAELFLLLNDTTYAFKDNSIYSDTTNKRKKTLTIDTPKAGLWYVSVYNNTTVSTKSVTLGQEYTKNTHVLNGHPYSLLIKY